ncbi:hypothetical protein AVEN_266986-1 [Araneus ventricosus]|uniref:Cytochrome P450 18a1 n=1 Tax=Araneus ventricosus TaxID=182803 RepID=A0A4Y2HG30_ARAVE|nr:hypothetical protein AVEN_266986-1 [Araneus ventricosus]
MIISAIKDLENNDNGLQIVPDGIACFEELKMEAITAIILCILTFLLSIWLISNKNHKKYPPGPSGLPIVGYYPFLTEKPYVKLTELSKIYGPVYSVRLGSRNVIIITDFEIMKEAFWKDDFMGRPPDLPFELSKETIGEFFLLFSSRFP